MSVYTESGGNPTTPLMRDIYGSPWAGQCDSNGNLKVVVDGGTVTVTGPTGEIDIQDSGGNALDSDGSGRLLVNGSQVTQPVSGSVAVTNLPATQPVSLAVAPTTPVTGTFWQTTQPISGTVSIKTPASAGAPTSASVGTSSAQAVAANASRTGLILINLSSGNISLGIGTTAVLNSGITLVPNAAWSMDQFSFSLLAINAIAANVSSNLSIQEFS